MYGIAIGGRVLWLWAGRAIDISGRSTCRAKSVVGFRFTNYLAWLF